MRNERRWSHVSTGSETNVFFGVRDILYAFVFKFYNIPSPSRTEYVHIGSVVVGLDGYCYPRDEAQQLNLTEFFVRFASLNPFRRERRHFSANNNNGRPKYVSVVIIHRLIVPIRTYRRSERFSIFDRQRCATKKVRKLPT